MQLAPNTSPARPTITLDDRIASRVKAADFAQWRSDVISTGGCAHPIHLHGHWSITHKTTGQTLAARSGRILVPCGTRRAALCPTCADRYAADAFHLIRAGLAGDDGKGIPASVADKPRFFLTLTAPTFGPVHSTPTVRGRRLRCPCGEHHHPADPRLSTPIDPDQYDYEAAVLWNNHAGELWARFTTYLARHLAQAAGLPVSRFRDHARLSYAKVAEYQRRGLIHFHAVIRLDGPTGPADPAPTWATPELIGNAIRATAQTVTIETCRPGGQVLELGWGPQLDVRTIRANRLGEVEDGDGEISEARLAGYVAKYATKSTGTTESTDRPIRSQLDIDHLSGIAEHHRRMIQTAWDLGGLPIYDGRNLRRWAHMLGFRGHFLTKSRRYSSTFRDIRATQATYRRTEALDRLGVSEDEVVVVNHWNFTGVGYRDDAERELAAAIAERIKDNRTRTPGRKEES